MPTSADTAQMPGLRGGKEVFIDSLPPGGVFSYIHAVQPLHERLRQILTQAAGYSLLVMTRGKRLAFLDAPVTSARDVLVTTRARIDSVRVPPAARQHHRHITAASAAIARSLDLLMICLCPSSDDQRRDDLARMLRIATEHLRAVMRLLPGFEMVDLSQACCAVHATQAVTPICQTAKG